MTCLPKTTVRQWMGAIVALCMLVSGCAYPLAQAPVPYITISDVPAEVAVAKQSDVPRELDKVALPTYRVEPPDILLIDAVNLIRPPGAPLRAGDQILVRVANTLPTDPEGDPIANSFKIINGSFLVQSNGTINLGPEYGTVVVAGLTVEQAEHAITDHLRGTVGLDMPLVAVELPDVTAQQPIAGEHLVRPDGTVSLGIYGNVLVAGLTLDEAKQAIEQHLAPFIHQPQVRVDVAAYNSKVYYVVVDGGGMGEQVIRVPVTGNETVLDAVAQIQGLPEISSKKIWIARPAPAGTDCAQILRVDWNAIASGGITTTNYQLLPGDRIYIEADHWIHFNNVVTKVVQPFEQIFGFILLGNGTVRVLQRGTGGTGTGFF